MKKILWFLVAFVLSAVLGSVLTNTWDSAKYFQENGKEASLKIGSKYNASRWLAPVPIKKIHSYVAVLAPEHEVVIESDQNIAPGEERFIRFLFRDSAEEVRKNSWRQLVGTIRLKSEADGVPVRLSDTNIFDRAVDKAMGPPGEGVYVRPKPVAEAAPSHEKPTVPFMFAGAQDSTLEIVWNNSSASEIAILVIWLIAIKMIILHAWVTPFDSKRVTGVERRGFIHPSMRRIATDAPRAEASAKIGYKPKGKDHDYIGIAKPQGSTEAPAAAPSVPSSPPPRSAPIQMPAHASQPSAPRPPEEPFSTATTAPFAPSGEGVTEPTLKLTRKPRATPTTAPMPGSGQGASPATSAPPPPPAPPAE